jgi:general secretion pathway protein E
MTGFMGRMGLYELLTVSEAFKDRVNQQPSIDALRRQAVTDGMRPLRLAGALRVAEGLTTLDEVLLATRLWIEGSIGVNPFLSSLSGEIHPAA